MKSGNRHYLCKSEVFGGAWGGKVGKDENCHGSCFGWYSHSGEKAAKRQEKDGKKTQTRRKKTGKKIEKYFKKTLLNCHGSCFGWHTRWWTRSGKNTRRKWNQFCSRNVQVLKWTLQFQRQWFIFSCRCFRCMADKFCALSVSGDTKSIMNYSLDDSLVKMKIFERKRRRKGKKVSRLVLRLIWPAYLTGAGNVKPVKHA